MRLRYASSSSAGAFFRGAMPGALGTIRTAPSASSVRMWSENLRRPKAMALLRKDKLFRIRVPSFRLTGTRPEVNESRVDAMGPYVCRVNVLQR